MIGEDFRIFGQFDIAVFEAVNDYTAAPHKFNRELRGGGDPDDDVFALYRALNALPERSGTTWRGDRRSFEEMSRLFRPGGVSMFESFQSTSSSIVRARGFAGRGGAIIEIRGKTGRWIGPISLYPSEREVLFAPTAAFRVKSVKRRGTYTYIVLEEL